MVQGLCGAHLCRRSVATSMNALGHVGLKARL